MEIEIKYFKKWIHQSQPIWNVSREQYYGEHYDNKI